MAGHVDVNPVCFETAFTIPNVVSDRALLQAAIVDPPCKYSIENGPFGPESPDLLLYFVRKNNLQMNGLHDAGSSRAHTTIPQLVGESMIAAPLSVVRPPLVRSAGHRPVTAIAH